MEERIENEKARAMRNRKRKRCALQHETLKMPDRQVRQLCIGMSSDIPPAQVLLCTPRGIPLYIAGPISQILRSVLTPLLQEPLFGAFHEVLYDRKDVRHVMGIASITSLHNVSLHVASFAQRVIIKECLLL